MRQMRQMRTRNCASKKLEKPDKLNIHQSDIHQSKELDIHQSKDFRDAILSFVVERDGKGRETAVKGTALKHLEQIIGKVVETNVHDSIEILYGRKACLPGYYRPSKMWDIVIKRGETVLAAIELKSLTRSHGNNFNSRVEECLGTITDFEAYCENAGVEKPFIGYLLLMDVSDCTTKKRSCSIPVLDKFLDSGYLNRANTFCETLRNNHDNVFAYTITYDTCNSRNEAGTCNEADSRNEAGELYINDACIKSFETFLFHLSLHIRETVVKR